MIIKDSCNAWFIDNGALKVIDISVVFDLLTGMDSKGCRCCDPQVNAFYEAGTIVGKGGIWDPETQNYYYTDIAGKAFLWFMR